MALFGLRKKGQEDINAEKKGRTDFVKKEKSVVQGFRSSVNKHNPVPRNEPKTKNTGGGKVHLNVNGQRITISSSGGQAKAPREVKRVPSHQSGDFIRFAGDKTIGRGSAVHGGINPIRGASRVFDNTRSGHDNVSRFEKNKAIAINNIFNRKPKR